MSRSRTLRVGLVAAAVFVGACGGGDASIAGTYNCAPPDPQYGKPDDVELREDGTLTITQHPSGGREGGTFEGTWSAEGDSGSFGPGTTEEETFTIEGDRLVFPDGFVCTPAR